MAGVAGGELADTVRAAGGIGLVAVGHGASDTLIDEQVGFAAARAGAADTAAPHADASVSSAGAWGVGLMSWSLALDGSALDRALGFEPQVIALSAGDPTDHARRAHTTGAAVVVQVGTSAEIHAADADPNIDLVVVRGSEGGGHGLDAVATLPLLQYAVSTCRTPVGAAGGIATAEGVAAVMAAGAVLAWVGTRFIPCSESLSPATQQAAVTGAAVDGTVHTSVFDLALGIPWPTGYGGRALRNAVTDAHAGEHEAALRAAVESGAPAAHELAERVAAARSAGDPSAAPVYAGQSAGLTDPRTLGQSAADVVAELAGFRELLAAAARRWGA